LRADALAAWRAGLAAADPQTAVERVLGRDDLASWRDADLVIATGKAAAPMARAAGHRAHGFVLLPTGAPAADVPSGMRVLRGAHPVPSREGVEASGTILRAAAALRPDERLLYLLSGGTSSLFEVPRDGVTLDSLAALYRALVECGAAIGEMNLVRRTLSQTKGGGLARAAGCAAILTLAVSDVVGDDPATIGSGPTVRVADEPDAAASVLERYHLWGSVADDVRRALRRPRAEPGGVLQPTRFEIVCSAAHSVGAAAAELRLRGYDVVTPPANVLTGEATAAADLIAAEAGRRLDRASMPWGFVMGGETTVRLGPAAGRGGRNLHVASAIALRLAGRAGFACAVAGTDGIDGNSDFAGAIVDGGTAARAAGCGRDLAAALARFDTAAALEAAGDALSTGPTGTNVGDLLVMAGAPEGARAAGRLMHRTKASDTL
jgi:glycerate-2-kinase